MSCDISLTTGLMTVYSYDWREIVYIQKPHIGFTNPLKHVQHPKWCPKLEL